MRLSLVRSGLILVTLGILGPGELLVAQTAPSQRPTGGEGAQGAAVPKLTPPAALKVDPGASQVYVKVGADGYGHIHGVQGRLASGTIKLGSGGDLVFDMKSFVADPAGARRALGLTKPVSAADQQKTTASMLGADVLDVARHPTAVFAIAAAIPLDGQPVGNAGRYRLQGEFTLHGVMRPLQLSVSLEPTDRPTVVRMRGEFTILQSEYGMKPYSALAGLVRVADKLEIQADLILGAAGR